MTSLYGLVIKKIEISRLFEIKNALIGIVNHLSANEKNCDVMHGFCKKGIDSWCNYQRAIALDTIPPKHPSYLSEECRQRALEILAPYICEQFLEKVRGGKTSNLNENLHKLIWEHVSKTGSVEIDLMNLGAALAVIRFNEGWRGFLKIFVELGIQPYNTFINFIIEKDNHRLSKSVQIGSEYSKKHRWGLKRSKRARKRTGIGYKSGPYSMGPSIPLCTDEGDYMCAICGGSEDTGIIGDTRRRTTEDDSWIQCDICYYWSHLFCLRQSKHIIEMPKKDELWFRLGCNRCSLIFGKLWGESLGNFYIPCISCLSMYSLIISLLLFIHFKSGLFSISHVLSYFILCSSI